MSFALSEVIDQAPDAKTKKGGRLAALFRSFA
jgi:hypothetical protein